MYKISHIINGAVKKIYVFNGPKKKSGLDKLFQKNHADPTFAGIFSPEELADIHENVIQVRFLPETLHLDDTIELIKKKLVFHLSDLNVAYEELYFFISQPEHFKAATVYQNLTQNEKLELTKERLVQFLLNIEKIDVSTIPDKEIYTYDDILSLNLEQDTFNFYKPLGQNITSLKDDYPYTVNPYAAEFYDPFLEKFADEIITTTNKNILMDHGGFLNNTIYLCLAEDVLKFGEEYNLTLAADSTLKIYFPYLHAKEINSLEQLEERKQELLGDTKAILTSTFEKNIENVNLFYDIYAQRKEELPFTDVGIKSLSLTIHQPTAIHMPLDNVFKLIHATQDIPLIKMNLTKRKEKIYRLYADKIATNGKKIPYLDKGVIFKWDKIMGKNKSVSVYIEHYQEETGSITPILCSFNGDGSISIEASFNASLTLEKVNELLTKDVNPVIDLVRDYLAQDGYTMHHFVDLANENTEILNIEFTMTIPIDKEIKIKKIVGCLTSMFNVVNDNFTNGILLRFKRVSNYNEMESQEALILDMLHPQLGYSNEDIVQALQTNFHLTQEKASEKYVEVKRAQDVMEAGNRKLKKRNNPGFLTSIVKQPFNNILMINVSGINHIGYLTTLQIYLDTLIRLSQKPSSTHVSHTAIKNICAGKKSEEEEQVPEIIAPGEQTHMRIEDEKLIINKPNEKAEEEEELDEEELDEEEMLSRFGYVEGEDEIIEEEEESGGASPRASEADSETESELDAESEEEEQLETNITGQSLSNPSPFEKRIRKYDKNLFATETGKKDFSSYATDCQMNRRRQPIVLTKQEKEKIDTEHPGSYSEALKYSSDPSKELWYICPRYWDMKNNTSLTEEEVDKNLVIPKKPPGNKVPAGKHIFEFNDYGIEHLNNGKYITHFPGFLKEPHKERGACLPCCFKKWEGIQAGLRAKCMKDDTIVVPPGRKKKKAAEEINEYILAPDKFPITQENRFGYLPIAVQKFLHTDNKKCQISEMNTNIKENHECLLRHSVEIHHMQSFIACIADVCLESHSRINKELVRPTVKRMKEILIECLTIDTFITLQNGNLLKVFYPKSDEMADMDKYADTFSKQKSKLYEMADKTNPEQMNALVRIARAYVNFVAYLKDDLVEIDYEYLWDLICKPHPKLFPKGINIVIIELARRDITDSVELICPSNHYASTLFDAKKSSILILKIDNFYEPIYAFKTTADEISINRTFNLLYKDTMPNIKYVLELVKKSFNSKCVPLPSMPVAYNQTHKFLKNMPLEKLIHDLQLINYTIEKQVMNYDSKIIGVVVIDNKDNSKGFLPCYPSAPTALTSNSVYMGDVFAASYEETKAFLEKVYTKSKRQIPCKPMMKIIEYGLIIGILTMTNQFVLIDEPTQDTFGTDLKIMKNTNYNEVDTTLSTSTAVDTDRVNYIKKIQLETKFYNMFRTTARYLLGQYEHNDIRREIEEKSKSTQLYLKKLRSVETLLRTLMKDYIQFHTYAEADLLKLDTITSCYNNCENKAYCQTNENACALLIPETNLINEKPNDAFYYGKLADEIIRYSRIKSFIFNPKSVLSFSQLKYNLRENEIILLHSLLNQEYFENITAAKVNRYSQYNTYDTTQPITTQNYTNVDDENFAEKPVADVEGHCETKNKEHIANKYWQAIFPVQSKESVYPSAPIGCSFNAILTLIQDYTEEPDLTRNIIKEILLSEYLKLYDQHGKQLLQVLRAQGKKLLVSQILKSQITLSTMLMSEEYYATILDVWLLAIYYKLPLIFISDTSLMENQSRFMVANKPADETEYYFLKVSAILPQIAPSFTLILSGEDKKIGMDELRSAEMQTKLRGAPSGNMLIPFLEKFSLTEAYARKRIIKPTKDATAAPVPAAPVPAAPTVAVKKLKLKVKDLK